MRRVLTALVWFLVTILVISGCTQNKNTSPAPTGPTAKPQVDNHESAPASPIAFGVRIPKGAVQLGPLVRWRSDELLESYLVDLEAAQAEVTAEEERKWEEELAANPEATRPTPEPVEPFDPTSAKDSFRLLDEPPRADTFLSLMRIDGEPTLVVRSLIAQLAALLPDADLPTDNLADFCDAKDRRIVRCSLDVEGTTEVGRELSVHLRVDPGDINTRTGNVASADRPVMVLLMRQLGDPHQAQAIKEAEIIRDVLDVTTIPETSDFIWPKMDESAPIEGPLIDQWIAPTSVSVLLTGRRPAFATIVAPRASMASDVAISFMHKMLNKQPPEPDVIVDLNERIISRHAHREDGVTVRTVQLTSARGNFVTLLLLPNGW